MQDRLLLRFPQAPKEEPAISLCQCPPSSSLDRRFFSFVFEDLVAATMCVVVSSVQSTKSTVVTSLFSTYSSSPALRSLLELIELITLEKKKQKICTGRNGS